MNSFCLEVVFIGWSNFNVALAPEKRLNNLIKIVTVHRTSWPVDSLFLSFPCAKLLPRWPRTPYFGNAWPCALILSFSSKTPSLNSSGGNESSMDETALQWRDGAEGERQRDTDSRESDVVDGTSPTAEALIHHRGSADKNKFDTSGYQVHKMSASCHSVKHPDWNLIWGSEVYVTLWGELNYVTPLRTFDLCKYLSNKSTGGYAQPGFIYCSMGGGGYFLWLEGYTF